MTLFVIRVQYWYDDGPWDEVAVATSPKGVAEFICQNKDWTRWQRPKQPSWESTSGSWAKYNHNYLWRSTLRVERVQVDPQEQFVEIGSTMNWS